MNPRDWKTLLRRFESGVAHKNPSTRRFQLSSARRLTAFLEGRIEPVDETALVKWLQERLKHRNVESAMGELTHVRWFLNFLEGNGHCVPGVLQRLRDYPNLLAQLLGPRPYDQLPAPWPTTLIAFEGSLRGLSILQQCRYLRLASEFVSHLAGLGLDLPTEEAFVSWLTGQLKRCRPSTVRKQVPALERFFQFLSPSNPKTNPVRTWRAHYATLGEGLIACRDGREAPSQMPRFSSFLSPYLEAFAAYRASMGYKLRLFPLCRLDQHASEHGLSHLEQLDFETLAACMTRFAHCTPTTQRKAHWAFHQFFLFLRRRSYLDAQADPMRGLPRPTMLPFRPHIYTLKEIAALLDAARTDPVRKEFDRQMYSTVLHLIYACGLRISEPLNLRVRDVDFTKRSLYIRKTKFGKDRHIPAGRRAAEYLASYLAKRIERLGEPMGSDYFFVCATGRHADPKMLGKVFREARTRASITSASGRPPRIHDLRHTHAVHRLYKWYLDGSDPGERLVLLSLYLGHVEAEYTQHYLHLSQDLLRIAGRPLERSVREWDRRHQEGSPHE